MEMQHQPIGIFDSGLGGISVLAEATQLLPTEDFLYYGDTGYAPYGDKKPEEVLERTHNVLDNLIEAGCKAIVIACNTATSVAGTLRQSLRLPVIGMEPALKPAALMPGSGEVLVLATQMTLSQTKFDQLMQKYGKDAVPVPCPGLMEFVEAGELKGPRVEDCLQTLLSPYKGRKLKAVVLGCTHYIFLRDAIGEAIGRRVPLIDGNQGTVRQLMRRLQGDGLLRPSVGPRGKVVFQTSAKPTEDALQAMQDMLALAYRLARVEAMHG